MGGRVRGYLDRYHERPKPVQLPEDAASISSNSLNFIYQDPSPDILWIGGSNGLDKFEKSSGKVLKRYSKSNGFELDAVMTIVGDDQDNLWIGTDSGLVRFNTHNENMKTYKEGDGLPGNKFNFMGACRCRR